MVTLRQQPHLWYPGPSCSKLTMLLFNVSLKLWSLNMAYMLIFLLKKLWVAFAFAKATHIVSAENTCELGIVLTRTVNILTTNELVKLTMFLGTGPWSSVLLYNLFNMSTPLHKTILFVLKVGCCKEISLYTSCCYRKWWGSATKIDMATVWKVGN